MLYKIVYPKILRPDKVRLCRTDLVVNFPGDSAWCAVQALPKEETCENDAEEH